MANRTFPFRLHAILDQAYELDLHGESHIISWTPSGRSFKVHDVEAFTRYLLPKYFPKQSQYKSFKRQLQYYGFSNFGWEHFGHPFFLRRQRDLVTHLKHKKSLGRNQDVAEQCCPPHSTECLPILLNDTEAKKIPASLLKMERVPSPTISIPPPATKSTKIQPDLFALSLIPSAQTRLSEQRLLDLLAPLSTPVRLPSRLAVLQAHKLMMMNQQLDSQDLLSQSNRLAELELRLALANNCQIQNMLNMF